MYNGYISPLTKHRKDMEMQKINREERINEFMESFVRAFDIDRIKDRVNHEYLDGGKAEARIENFLRSKLAELIVLPPAHTFQAGNEETCTECGENFRDVRVHKVAE